jgi:hypothetical protein
MTPQGEYVNPENALSSIEEILASHSRPVQTLRP